MKPNLLVTIFAMILSLIIGVVGFFSPITIAKITILGPWIDPSLEDTMKPRAREARRLIRDNPDEFARRFSSVLDLIRMSSGVAWLMFFLTLLTILGSF